MFNLKSEADTVTLEITLPEGLSQDEIITISAASLKAIEEQLHGKNVQIYGRCTTALALMLGHKLAHICASVSIYDPKMAGYVLAIKH